MKFNTDHCRTTRATRSHLAAALRDPKGALHRATPNVGAKSGSYQTALMEPSVTAGKELAQTFMECVLAVHTVNCAAENMDGSVVKTDSEDTKHKPQLQVKTAVKSSSDKRGEIEHVLAVLGIMMKADVEATVESRLT